MTIGLVSKNVHDRTNKSIDYIENNNNTKTDRFCDGNWFGQLRQITAIRRSANVMIQCRRIVFNTQYFVDLGSIVLFKRFDDVIVVWLCGCGRHLMTIRFRKIHRRAAFFFLISFGIQVNTKKITSGIKLLLMTQTHTDYRLSIVISSFRTHAN